MKVAKAVNLFLALVVAIGSFAQEFSGSWKDVNYAGDTMKYHLLDIYLPVQQKTSYPVVVMVTVA